MMTCMYICSTGQLRRSSFNYVDEARYVSRQVVLEMSTVGRFSLIIIWNSFTNVNRGRQVVTMMGKFQSTQLKNGQKRVACRPKPFVPRDLRKSCMIFATLTGNKSCAILISVKTKIHQELCKPRPKQQISPALKENLYSSTEDQTIIRSCIF